MEIRALAETVVFSGSVEAKLTPAREELTDADPGESLRPLAPGRPQGLHILPASEAPIPGIDGMTDPRQRPRIIHALANHEFQAAELFAWALLAFPDSPPEFRRGLVRILGDEQRHTRMYLSRLEAHGVRFGDYPVTGYFWNKVPDITSPARFVCAMSLTFENANLDHTVDYAEAARQAGDTATAAVIDRIHEDEITHVRFGWEWLRRFKAPGLSMWEAYTANVTWPLRAAKARGRRFHPRGRERAGLDPEFIRLLEASEREERGEREPS